MSRLPTVLPAPVLPRLHGGPRLRWGILAPGSIAGRFAHALHAHTDQRVVGVGSRSSERAQQFAALHEIERAYGAYEALVADPMVDAVYVAPPHTEHRKLALLAIAAGKHVLVEKPLAATADEAREIADAAHRAGVFAMEAMHTRFHPRTTVIERLLADGVLGDIRMVLADIGFGFPVDHTSRLYDPTLGGGATLDLGVYPIWFSTFVLNAFETVEARGTLTETGVDNQSVAILTTASAQQAVVTTNMLTFSPSEVSINGTDARIHVNSRHPLPGPFVLIGADNRPHLPFTDDSGIVLIDGLCRQAAWMAQHVADGLLESPMHPLATSIAVLEVIDQVRRELGVSQLTTSRLLV